MAAPRKLVRDFKVSKYESGKVIGDYTIITPLTAGAEGEVYLVGKIPIAQAEVSPTYSDVAPDIRIMKIAHPDHEESLHNEIKILRELNGIDSTLVPDYYECGNIITGITPTVVSTGDNITNFFVMEKFDGSLTKLCQEDKTINPKLLEPIVTYLIKKLHALEYTHNDFHLSNVLYRSKPVSRMAFTLEQKYDFVITDFGKSSGPNDVHPHSIKSRVDTDKLSVEQQIKDCTSLKGKGGRKAMSYGGRHKKRRRKTQRKRNNRRNSKTRRNRKTKRKRLTRRTRKTKRNRK